MRKKVKIVFILLMSIVALGIILSSLISNSYIEDNQKMLLKNIKKCSIYTLWNFRKGKREGKKL